MISTMANSSVPKSNQKKIQVAVPYKVLQILIKKQVTGTLTIKDPYDNLINWLVYLEKGKIVFATSSSGQTEKLTYILSQFLPQEKIDFNDRVKNDYELIHQLVEKHNFGEQKLKDILLFATRDALTCCLGLPRAQVVFKKELPLEPILFSFGIKTLPLSKTLIHGSKLENKYIHLLCVPSLKSGRQSSQH